jgi:hypothetical protein
MSTKKARVKYEAMEVAAVNPTHDLELAVVVHALKI